MTRIRQVGTSNIITLPLNDCVRNGWEVKDDWRIFWDAGWAISPEGELKQGLSNQIMLESIPELEQMVEELDGGRKSRLKRLISILKKFEPKEV